MTARYLAVKALMRQEQNGYANLVLDSELKACKPPLSPRDAAFASGIFYTVLERRSLLDWMLAQFSKRPLEKLDAPVRAILRAGLAQAKFMDVPLPAAVNESVKLAKAFGKTSAAGMVNAMLRRTAALDPKPEHWSDLEERLRTYYCLSQPIAALFAAQYPQDAEAMAAAFYQRRPTAIRVNPLREKHLLCIRVVDNGVGIQPEQLQQLRGALSQPGERWEHIGIYNVAARLRLLDRNSRLVIRSHPGRGTAVVLYLPLVENEEEFEE